MWRALSSLFFAAAWLMLAPPPARAQSVAVVHRCVDANGNAIFTDRQCGDLKARDQAAPVAPGHGGRTVAVRGCARTRDDLLAGVQAALAAQDVNRLANYFQWTGMGTREAYGVMDELSQWSARPLVAVRLVTAEEPTSASGAAMPASTSPLAPVPAPAPAPLPDAATTPPAATAPESAPLLLRVDQGTSATDPGAHVTYFRLSREAGCWWLQR